MLHVPSQEETGSKRKKTMDDRNAALAPGMAASMAPWLTLERRKLLDAVEAHGKRAWQKVADAVGSRTAIQCMHQYRDLKKAGRLDRISEDTPLSEKKLKGLYQAAITKCAKNIDGKRITTVGQLAALDLDISKPENKIYLMKLTGKKGPSPAVDMAAPWKAKAIEALAFWK